MRDYESPRGGRLRLNHHELGLPDDAEIVGVSYNSARRQFLISLIHESLPPVDSLETEWPDISVEVDSQILFRVNVVAWTGPGAYPGRGS